MPKINQTVTTMREDDKQVFAKGRPYIVGLVALAFTLRGGWKEVKRNERLLKGQAPGAGQPDNPFSDSPSPFDDAEAFVGEFERRNGIK